MARFHQGRSLEQQAPGSSVVKELHLALRRVLSTSDRARVLWSRAARVLRSFQVCVVPSGSYSFTFDIEPERGEADSGDLAVDELQEASPEDLAALNVALHNLGQDVFPVVFVGAGLPSLPAALADATSYAERLYDYVVGASSATNNPRAAFNRDCSDALDAKLMPNLPS